MAKEPQTVVLNHIKPINVDTVHKICSGQVVLSLAVAVKELVENSLDAGATNIDVRLKNYGLDLIEVSDNGSGVTEHNFAALTLKYHTSKLTDYSDLLEVSSFGFRGEALSSLCSLADLTITTRHKNYEYATKIQYDHKGNIVSKCPCSRQIGTTVTLSNLFKTLPVRQKEFQKNAKREFNKMTNLLYAYCLVSVGVKITCSNQTSSKSLVVATQGSKSIKDNIACVFGIKQLQSILEIKTELVSSIKDNIFKGLSGTVTESEESVYIDDVEIDLSEDSNDTQNNDVTDIKISELREGLSHSQKSQGYKNVVNPLDLEGFVSSCAHGSGRSSTDRQYYYINSRPCEPTKLIKLVNDIYRQYNPNQYPFVFINIKLDKSCVDVNVTPDKRKVFLTREKAILDAVKLSLSKLFENIPSNIKIEPSSKVLSQVTDVKPDLDQPRIFNSFIKQFSKDNDCEDDVATDDRKHINKNVDLKRKSSTLLDFVNIKSKKINDDESNHSIQRLDKNTNTTYLNVNRADSTSTALALNGDVNNKTENTANNINNHLPIEVIVPPSNNHEQEIMYLEGGDLPDTQIRSINDIVLEESHTIYCKTKTTPTKAVLASNKECKQKIVTDKNEIGKCKKKYINLKTSLDHVKALANIYNNQKSRCAPEKVKFKGVINPVYNKKCEEELSREISKDCFKQMDVIGQFNLGFIITRLDDDLFIVDQHATDEIYNFETLQKTTELTHQKLVIPQQLELSGVNEQILMDNLDIFKKNGFTFEINEKALPTKRVKLITIPMSKNWIFGKEDIEELLFMLRESQSEHCRPSRIRAMFASRACRKSVMIGTALGKGDMKKLVDHMAEIDKPWNCPHGRPTIRHLVNLAMIDTSDN